MLKQYAITMTLDATDVDLSEKWRISCALRTLQRIATEHAEAIGLGRDALIAKGAIWVLARLKIQIDKLPMLGEKITLTTFPGNPNRTLFPRYYTIDNANGRLGSMSTIWMLVNPQSHRLLNVSQLACTYPDMNDIVPPLPLPERLPQFDNPTTTTTRRCVYSDLDINGHMNNASYADWICDLFDASRFRKQELRELQINYLSEVYPAEEIRLDLREDNDSFAVQGISLDNNKTMFSASGLWV